MGGSGIDEGAFSRWADADSPRRTGGISGRGVLEVLGPLTGSACLTFTVCRFFGWDGLLAPTVVALVLFLGVYSQVVKASAGQEAAIDRVMAALVVLGAMAATAVLAGLVLYVVAKGAAALSLSFFVQDMATTGPEDPGGGAFHAIVGTVQQCGIATIIAVPMAVLSAIYLNEIKGRMAVAVRFLVDAMSGVPSIVAGMFIYAFWMIGLNQGPSGFAAALALTVLMLPTVTRTAEEVLRTIPDSLREASFALGAPQWRTVVRIVLPTARSGLLTAVLLGMARIVGETAPVLLTAKGSPATNWNAFEGQQSDLPLFIYGLLRQPNKAQLDRAYSGALVLLILVALLFAVARIAGSGPRRRR
ncbi:MAG: phosphate ABC transporter permease PstA [Acidimicrobiales bacterium]